MRVFITGATGFLGAALARALARAGAEVHALARARADRTVLEGTAITWHLGDVTAPTSLRGAMDGAEWIVHAAGRLGQSGVREEVYQRLHVEGTRNVMAEALTLGNPPRVHNSILPLRTCWTRICRTSTLRNFFGRNVPLYSSTFTKAIPNATRACILRRYDADKFGLL